MDLIDVAIASSPPSDPSTTQLPISDHELDYAKELLMRTHDPDLVLNLERKCRDSRQRRIDEGKDPLGFVGYIDDDTYVTTETYDVCLRATACWIRAVDHVLSGSNSNACQAAMALTRPPGHHATKRSSNGFCIFNFAAAAALHAIEKDPELKVSMFDWDVHYGQGVVDIVKHHPRVRYASIHQSPAFPYLGTKAGTDGDHNNILTLPILADTTWTCGYRQKFEDEIIPFLKSNDSWNPSLVIICSGYDALDSDELAGVSLQARDYGEMTRQIRQHLNAPLVLGLEGGYQLKDAAGGGNLADAVVETAGALLEGEG